MQVVVSGLHTNNTANILGSFSVCNSTIYITDLVLLPADSLQGIPQAPAVLPPARAGEIRGWHGTSTTIKSTTSFRE